MITYKEFKTWITEHKPQIIYGVAFVVVFLVGFGSGYEYTSLRAKSKQNTIQYPNYTSKTGQNKETKPLESPPSSPSPTPSVLPALVNSQECIVKVSSSGIYHLKGGVFYDRVTKPIRCFLTEAGAKAAGFRKSSR